MTPDQERALKDRLDSLDRENAHLRIVHQKFGCPYGHNAKGFCELGYPGCACMDDLMAMSSWAPEDESKAAVRIGKLLFVHEAAVTRLQTFLMDAAGQMAADARFSRLASEMRQEARKPVRWTLDAADRPKAAHGPKIGSSEDFD